MCEKVEDVSLLTDIPRDLVAEYKNLIVHPSMSCEDIPMIELVLGLKVLNRDLLARRARKSRQRMGWKCQTETVLERELRTEIR